MAFEQCQLGFARLLTSDPRREIDDWRRGRGARKRIEIVLEFIESGDGTALPAAEYAGDPDPYVKPRDYDEDEDDDLDEEPAAR